MAIKFTTSAFVVALVFTPGLVQADNEEQVLASYGSAITVTKADFLAVQHALPPQVRGKGITDPKVITQLLDTILLNRVLAEQAKQMRLNQSPEVRAELDQAVERVLSVRRMEAFEATLSVPDYTQAAKEQYEIHKSRYFEPEQVEATHILIGKTTRTGEQARELADEVRSRATSGEDFGKLVVQYSEDTGSKSRGGSLGYFARGRMVKPFEDAAFNLKNAGDISPVVESSFGFHIIKLIGRRDARQRSFDEVKDQIIAPMRSKFLADEKARYTSQIRNDPSITLNTKEIDNLIRGGAGTNSLNHEISQTAEEKK